MNNFIKVSFGIFFALALSRLIPHPPNFTNLIALSFYVPSLIGRKYIISILVCFFITDLFIGFHSTTFFTWGSIIIIGLSSQFFKNNFFTRILGSISGTMIFFIVSNFGVWIVSHIHSLNKLSLIETYYIAIPFYANTLISTIFFSLIIEYFLTLKKVKFFLKKI